MSQSDRVTDLIMHYYMEHGRNRDLEKYLRLRRMSNATRSSSDGSLPCLDEMQRRVCMGVAADRSGAGRSMENLSTLRKKADQQRLDESEKSLRNASAESAKSLATSPGDKVGAATSTDTKGVTVKEKKVEQKTGRNFNFNLESVIEINLPPPPTITLSAPGSTTVAPITYTQPEPLPQVQPIGIQSPPRVVLHETSTQTAASEDDPIRPVVKAHTAGNADAEALDSTKDLSPVSSIASNKQRLEWDSLGDIGYDSSERLQFCGASDLNETEKRCLQRYFARKGLTFDRSVIVVRQREEKDKKFVRPNADVSIMTAKPEAQSTPKVPSNAFVAREEAKSTQTSLRSRGTESRGIQVSQGPRQESIRPSDEHHRQDKAIGTTDSLTLASVDAAESFEFFSPSVPETGNNTPSVAASLSTPAHSSSTTSSSAANGATSSNRSLRPTFDDEVKLGLTLYNSICELKSMPTGVKESLIDKIFRKLSRHDPKRRTRQQLLLDYAKAVRRPDERVASRPEADERHENVYDDVSPCVEEIDPTDSNSPQMERSLDVVEVVEETIASKTEASSESVSVGSVKESTSGSNEAKNDFHHSSSGGFASVENSSHRTVSSQPESGGTTKQNLPRKMSAPEARDRRMRKAMQDYLKPMTTSEVEYENFRQMQNRAVEHRAKDSQLVQIDREIEQLLVKKMLLLNTGSTSAGPTLPVKEIPCKPAISVPLASERSGTVYTSVHEPISASSTSKDSSSAWNSHYHMAKAIKNRSKLETPTGLTSTPSDVSIPTFIKQKKDQFVENYEQIRKRRAFEEQNHIYTRPYSSGGHRNDNRRQQDKENHGFAKARYGMSKISKGPNAALRGCLSSGNTVLSPEFISSDSISIPVVTTLTNTTTTHHYDIKSRVPSPTATKGRSAGTQTTDSILRTKPIFGKTKQKHTSVAASVQAPSEADVQVPPGVSGVQCNCPCSQQQRRVDCRMRSHAVSGRTEIIDGTAARQDKQAQTKPSSIAYVITFEGTPSERKARQSVETPEPSSSMATSESEPENGKDNESEKMLTLREQFRRSCPATLTRIEERRQCISELNKLRNKRNQQRQRLLLLTSDDSLRRTTKIGKGKLPPPPLSQRRVFPSTRAIRENTRKQVRNLPEVQRKKEIERFNNLKRKNRILKDVYNKNLQRKVLKGHVDLSNSVRVIQD
ncbi:centrosome-associated protein Alms1a-like [Anopheles nili]|uniref:centrosome-associated protein Alms1a-like n=1 Tax=Anopheles nili TaxID=185578 RepID=UPI00237B8B28|nr:centrosome-associated protein Alms1a-like [Anopheles nili]